MPWPSLLQTAAKQQQQQRRRGGAAGGSGFFPIAWRRLTGVFGGDDGNRMFGSVIKPIMEALAAAVSLVMLALTFCVAPN